MNKVPVPLAIRLLIEQHRERINQSLNSLTEANIEFMRMVNLLPEDGWRLDIDNMQYLQVIKTQDEPTSVE